MRRWLSTVQLQVITMTFDYYPQKVIDWLWLLIISRCGNAKKDTLSAYCIHRDCSIQSDLAANQPICARRLPHDAHGCVKVKLHHLCFFHCAYFEPDTFRPRPGLPLPFFPAFFIPQRVVSYFHKVALTFTFAIQEGGFSHRTKDVQLL